MKHIEHGNCDKDDSEFLPKFLETILGKNRSFNKNKNIARNQIIQISLIVSCDNINLNNMALNCLYYLGDYIIFKIEQTKLISDICINATGSINFTTFSYAELT